MTLVNRATGEIVATCTADEARALTERIKNSAEALATLLLEAYERRAWAALSYDSWRAYATAEFGMSQSQAYRVLDLARIVRAIEAAADSPIGEIRESEARDIKPVLADVTADLEKVRELPQAERPAATREVIETHRARVVEHRRAAAPPQPTPEEPDLARDVAAAKAEARTAPSYVAGKAIDSARDLVQIVEAAGGVEAIIADLSSGPLGDTLGSLWIEDLDRVHDLTGQWAAALRRLHLRSVK